MNTYNIISEVDGDTRIVSTIEVEENDPRSVDDFLQEFINSLSIEPN